MKQEEKHQQSRERILCAAIEEFGEKGYDGASLNTLLSVHGISKGLVYHYFENRDQLYLACVRLCFDLLMESLSCVEKGNGALCSYFEIRGRFFRERPGLKRIFFDALIQPPQHLGTELAEARFGFTSFNRALFQSVLNTLRLREGVSEAEALSYFDLVQNTLHIRCASTAESYEEQARKTMDILLYGLVGGEKR